MANRLRDAVSPYLRSHADNPVDWWQWSTEAFDEAERRDVPVMISIGYSTCHWCHVMARESFSDPAIADYLESHFVSIKVDREEYPDVDASYLAAAGAFTQQLGWPLTVFATPAGVAFFAGTYFPPEPVQGRASFRQVLEAVVDAWRDRRDDVEGTAAAIAAALRSSPAAAGPEGGERVDFDRVVDELLASEDTTFGGFGSAPKFPVATVIGMLVDRASLGDDRADGLARRTLQAMAASELRDPVEGGFFRYAVQRDWTEPHYERMLYDNALLLPSYARIGDVDTAAGIARFLLETLSLPGGGFASAQDSESTVDGVRVEGGYYALRAEERAAQLPPALDEKRLTGWNGLAIEGLAIAGTLLDRPDWIEGAREAADVLLSEHVTATGELLRASIAGRVSSAKATLEDYGMLAAALVELAIATGDVVYLERGRDLVTAVLDAADLATASPFGVPGGADPVLAARGLVLDADPSEGAYPSGLSAMAGACVTLALVTGEGRFEDAARSAARLVGRSAGARPIAFGSMLGVVSALAAPRVQFVVVGDDAQAAVARMARRWRRSGGVAIVVTESQARAFEHAGFELFAGKSAHGGVPTAYVCRSFVCELPATDPAALARDLEGLEPARAEPDRADRPL